MVKLYALNVLRKTDTTVHWLKTSYDVNSFSFFQRRNVQEFMAFVSKTVVERTQLAARQSVKEGEYLCHVYVRSDGLAGVVISDHEYPPRVAHTLLGQILNDFSSKVPASDWSKDEALIDYPHLPGALAKYQNPKEADAMTKMQEDLDETKIILHNTITAVLERGEKLDDLVSKSEDLTLQSKAFYKTAPNVLKMFATRAMNLETVHGGISEIVDLRTVPSADQKLITTALGPNLLCTSFG